MPKRNPRFTRVDLNKRTLLTDRDQAILRAVKQYGFLRSSQIAELVGGSHQQVLRRLQRLFHVGELERPTSQIEYYRAGGGSRELVYSTRGKSVQRFYLHHALAISDICIAFERACRVPANDRFCLLQEDEISEHLAGRDPAAIDPFQWHVDITRHLRVGVRPDRVLQIAVRDSIFPESERATFFIEADRGTMPIARSGLEQTSILRKLVAYHSTWAQGIHRGTLGIQRFRVLIVTSDATRMQNMVEACQQIERGRRLFLFATHGDIATAQDIFRVPLINGNGELDGLLSSVGLFPQTM